MKHEQINTACLALGLKVRQAPDSVPGVRHYLAVPENNLTPRVCWRTSSLGGLLGLPRVTTKDGRDTHARTIKEIQYLVNL